MKFNEFLNEKKDDKGVEKQYDAVLNKLDKEFKARVKKAKDPIEKAFYKIILKNFVKGNSSGYSKVELLSAFKRDINWIDADDFYDD
jgi:hypothetical protein|tara:strand:+ start:1438 stop:1698 length:261 start_codon:yes stop_codon:yes gene_type:complete